MLSYHASWGHWFNGKVPVSEQCNDLSKWFGKFQLGKLHRVAWRQCDASQEGWTCVQPQTILPTGRLFELIAIMKHWKVIFFPINIFAHIVAKKGLLIYVLLLRLLYLMCSCRFFPFCFAVECDNQLRSNDHSSFSSQTASFNTFLKSLLYLKQLHCKCYCSLNVFLFSGWSVLCVVLYMRVKEKRKTCIRNIWVCICSDKKKNI